MVRHSSLPQRTGLVALLGLCISMTLPAADQETAALEGNAAAQAQPASNVGVSPSPAEAATTAVAGPATAQSSAAGVTAKEPRTREIHAHQEQAATRKPPGGWKAMTKGNTVYWCIEEQPMGTRARRELRCMTPDQYDANVVNTQKAVDESRKGVLPPKGG